MQGPNWVEALSRGLGVSLLKDSIREITVIQNANWCTNAPAFQSGRSWIRDNYDKRRGVNSKWKTIQMNVETVYNFYLTCRILRSYNVGNMLCRYEPSAGLDVHLGVRDSHQRERSLALLIVHDTSSRLRTVLVV